MKIGGELTGALDSRSRRGRKTRLSVVVGGVRYPLLKDPRSKIFRVRKRTKETNVDFSTGLLDLEAAKEFARDELSKTGALQKRRRSGGATLQEVVDAYKAMPKRCDPATAAANVQRFAKIVDYAWGKRLADLHASDLSPRLWEDYAAKRQGGKLNLSRRTHENRGINAAMRMAVSIFHEGLEQGYERAGIGLDFASVRRIEWLPEIPSKIQKLAQENIDALMAALVDLKKKNLPMWRAIMIARFAGLRSKEISGARKSWLVKNSADAWCFEVRDRPEENWWHKTGEDYTAPILSAELIEDLLACPNEGFLVPVQGTTRDRFFRKLCNDWLRKGATDADGKDIPFIPKPHKGLHRLRALYAEALKAATAKVALAEQIGLEAASKALGHTKTRTTSKHYIPTP